MDPALIVVPSHLGRPRAGPGLGPERYLFSTFDPACSDPDDRTLRSGTAVIIAAVDIAAQPASAHREPAT